MTDMNKIADKIQKLLSLAGNNPSQEEAQAALMKAQKLMADYNVSMSDLHPGEASFKCSLEIANVKANPRDNAIQWIISNAFACKPLISVDRKLMFFGRADNAKAAKSCMEFTHKTLEHGIKKICRDYGMKSSEKGASAIYNGYAKGFIEGLSETVGKQTVALSIVVTKDVEDEYNKRFTSTRKYASKGYKYNPQYRTAYTQGKIDGSSVMDRRSLNAGEI